MGWFNTHREFPKVEKDINPDYLTVPLPLYDCDVNRRDMADYHESVRVVDRCFGRIMNVIERAGLRENYCHYPYHGPWNCISSDEMYAL